MEKHPSQGPMGLRGTQLNNLEKTIHKYYKDIGMLEVFPSTRRYSEWLYTDDEELSEVIETALSDKHNGFGKYFISKKL